MVCTMVGHKPNGGAGSGDAPWTGVDVDEKTCPLCCEAMDVTDQSFMPCQCGYQVCAFCYKTIKDEMNGLCPACRQPYRSATQTFVPPNPEQIREDAKLHKERGRQPKPPSASSRKNLLNVRVIQRNLVYVIGLALEIADEKLLSSEDYFGKYGAIQKVVVNQKNLYNAESPLGPSVSAYVTYEREDDALLCIHNIDGTDLCGRRLGAFFGTTKYCTYWLRSTSCPNPDCMFLHSLAPERDSFIKEEMNMGKSTFREKIHPSLSWGSEHPQNHASGSRGLSHATAAAGDAARGAGSGVKGGGPSASEERKASSESWSAPLASNSYSTLLRPHVAPAWGTNAAVKPARPGVQHKTGGERARGSRKGGSVTAEAGAAEVEGGSGERWTTPPGSSDGGGSTVGSTSTSSRPRVKHRRGRHRGAERAEQGGGGGAAAQGGGAAPDRADGEAPPPAEADGGGADVPARPTGEQPAQPQRAGQAAAGGVSRSRRGRRSGKAGKAVNAVDVGGWIRPVAAQYQLLLDPPAMMQQPLLRDPPHMPIQMVGPVGYAQPAMLDRRGGVRPLVYRGHDMPGGIQARPYAPTAPGGALWSVDPRVWGQPPPETGKLPSDAAARHAYVNSLEPAAMEDAVTQGVAFRSPGGPVGASPDARVASRPRQNSDELDFDPCAVSQYGLAEILDLSGESWGSPQAQGVAAAKAPDVALAPSMAAMSVAGRVQNASQGVVGADDKLLSGFRPPEGDDVRSRFLAEAPDGGDRTGSDLLKPKGAQASETGAKFSSSNLYRPPDATPSTRSAVEAAAPAIDAGGDGAESSARVGDAAAPAGAETSSATGTGTAVGTSGGNRDDEDTASPAGGQAADQHVEDPPQPVVELQGAVVPYGYGPPMSGDARHFYTGRAPPPGRGNSPYHVVVGGAKGVRAVLPNAAAVIPGQGPATGFFNQFVHPPYPNPAFHPQQMPAPQYPPMGCRGMQGNPVLPAAGGLVYRGISYGFPLPPPGAAGRAGRPVATHYLPFVGGTGDARAGEYLPPPPPTSATGRGGQPGRSGLEDGTSRRRKGRRGKGRDGSRVSGGSGSGSVPTNAVASSSSSGAPAATGSGGGVGGHGAAGEMEDGCSAQQSGQAVGGEQAAGTPIAQSQAPAPTQGESSSGESKDGGCTTGEQGNAVPIGAVAVPMSGPPGVGGAGADS